jgi:chemotaxis protein MotB
MRIGRTILIVGGIAILMSCAGQPKPAPQEDPRIGQLQSQVDALQKQNAASGQLQAQVVDLQKQVSDKDAAIKQLQAQIDDLQNQSVALAAQKNTDDDQIAATNERIGKLQKDLDGAKQDDATTTAELNSLNAKLAALENTNDKLSADIDSLRSGSTAAKADYLAQIDSLNKEKASLQDKIDSLTKEQKALEVAAQRDEKELDARIAQLKSLFSKELASGEIDIRRFRDILIISVKESALFAPDSPKLRPETMVNLKKLSEVFKAAPDRIVRIEGNTAVAVSSPESLKLYPTSWQLGAARAANVAQYLQEKCGMDPQQLVATSLGQFRPRADNSTEVGKAQNRRVDFILIARSLYEIDQMKTVAE